MCTLTYVREGSGDYTICFNRDERRTRAPGISPFVTEDRGPKFLAPRDGDHGGSWIAVNERGFSVALLNFYELESGRASLPAPADPISRGLLVLDLMAAGSIVDAAVQLNRSDLQRYRPFRLAAFDRTAPPVLFEWDGAAMRSARVDLDALPLSSSSWNAPLVERSRRAEFEQAVVAVAPLDVSALERFHRAHLPERGPLSPCMHRDDASTVSFARLSVGRDRAALHYAPGPPCETAVASPVTLDLETSR